MSDRAGSNGSPGALGAGATGADLDRADAARPDVAGADATGADAAGADAAGLDVAGDAGVVARGSGDAAVRAAEERAAGTRGLNLDTVAPLPIATDTANVRLGPEIDHACLSLLPLVGVWQGTGVFGNEPGRQEPQFGQRITISHDGRPFLRYESVTWLLDERGGVGRPGAREVGFWRPQPDGSIELLVAHAEGRIEVFYGQPRSLTAWAMSTDATWRTPTAPPVVGATRLYGITPDGRLAYVEERAHTDVELSPHASAALDRLAG